MLFSNGYKPLGNVSSSGCELQSTINGKKHKNNKILIKLLALLATIIEILSPGNVFYQNTVNNLTFHLNHCSCLNFCKGEMACVTFNEELIQRFRLVFTYFFVVVFSFFFF